MSEKHLTESAWKSFITKEKFKDPSLGKALSAYEKTDAKDFDERLKALAVIEKEVATLAKSKEVKANEDVEEYLEEVDREIPKARKAVEAAKKAAESEDEEEEEEGGADPGAIKKKVMGFLAQVKSKGPGDKPIQFIAAIAKGGTGVLFGKSVGATQKKMFQEMLPNMQSPKYITGDCIWEENAHTFVVEKIPSNLGKRLQKALLAETQVKWKVRVRGLDGQVVDADEEQEVAEDEGEETTTQSQQPPPPAPPAPPSAEQRGAFMERLKAIKPEMDKVIAANVTASAETKTLFAELAGFARGGNFESALAGFDRLEALVKTGSQQMATPAQEGDPAGKFRERLAAFLPKLKEVVTANPPLGGEIRTLVMEAGAQAKAGNYDQANSLMDRAQGLAAGGGQQSTQQSGNQPNEEAPTNESEGEQQGGDQQADDPETVWLKKFAEMEPDYLEAVKAAPGNEAAESLISRLKAIWNLAGAKAEAEAYPVSVKALEAIAKEDLFNKIRAARGTGGGIEQGIVEKRKFLVSRFQQIQVTLSAELEKLKTAMVGMLEGDEEEDPEEIVSQFDGYLEKLVDSIRDEIDEAINAGDMKSIAGMRTRIEGDEVIQHLLSNPFVNGSEFQAAFLDAVSEVEAKLAA